MQDLIDRQAAIDAARDWYEGMICGSFKGLEKRLQALPSAQPERKTGRWEERPDPYGFFDTIPVCSECGCTTKMREKTRYCPNCGAYMKGETDG